MSEVYPYLFISSANVAREKDFLIDNNISIIINCAKEESMNKYPSLTPSLKLYHIPLIDDEEPNAKEMILAGARMIQVYSKEDKNILVHCKAGISRSATVILAWMIVYKNIPFDTAYKYLQIARPIICPNDFYIGILKTLKNTST
jgi:protein-tyrosine phosphatase